MVPSGPGPQTNGAHNRRRLRRRSKRKPMYNSEHIAIGCGAPRNVLQKICELLHGRYCVRSGFVLLGQLEVGKCVYISCAKRFDWRRFVFPIFRFQFQFCMVEEAPFAAHPSNIPCAVLWCDHQPPEAWENPTTGLILSIRACMPPIYTTRYEFFKFS